MVNIKEFLFNKCEENIKIIDTYKNFMLSFDMSFL